MLRSIKWALCAVLPAALLALTPAYGLEKDYPQHPIRLVVPFPAGGGADAVARILAERLGVALGQPVIVDNRAGAGGSIGALLVARAPADGYTLLLNNNGHAIVPNLQTVNWDPVKDFAAISQVSVLPMIIFTSAQSRFASIDDVIKSARTNPRKLSYGSSGIGGPLHLGMELFANRAGIKLLHVPYKGNAQMITALVAGEIDLEMDTQAVSYPMVREGRFRALATASAKRLGIAPELPTLAESGLAGFSYEGWQGMFAPAGTPAPIVARLNKELNVVLALPEVRQKLEALGNEPHASSPLEFSAMVAAESRRYRQIIQDNQIKAE